jgi:YEATS domain-containing protein 4
MTNEGGIKKEEEEMGVCDAVDDANNANNNNSNTNNNNNNTINSKQQQERMDLEEYVLPISYGSVAYWLGKKADEYHSHEWTVYLRGQCGIDLTHVIESVTFHLHPSFNEPKRVLVEPPYEVTETGWGEFEIAIEIKFLPFVGEDKEKLVANLKLFPDSDEVQKFGPQTTKKPLIVEQREELVFHKPKKSLWDAVKKTKKIEAETERVYFEYKECEHEQKSKHWQLWKNRQTQSKDDEELMKLWCAQKVTEERCAVLKAQLLMLDSYLES